MSKHPIEDNNRSGNTTIEEVIQRRVNRRQVLVGGMTVTAATFLGSLALPVYSSGKDARVAPVVANPDVPLSLNFAAVPKSLADRVVLPEGYSAHILYALGDPISAELPDGLWQRWP